MNYINMIKKRNKLKLVYTFDNENVVGIKIK